jgi:hypothetical protein
MFKKTELMMPRLWLHDFCTACLALIQPSFSSGRTEPFSPRACHVLATVVAVAVARPFCFGACVLVSEAHGHSQELRSKRRLKSKQATSEVPGCIAQEADMVIEAAVERLDIKQAVFAELEKVCRPDCVLSSNTSTINLDLISAKMRGRDRAAGAHSFSPAHVMPLLEIVRTDHSSPQVCAYPPPPSTTHCHQNSSSLLCKRAVRYAHFKATVCYTQFPALSVSDGQERKSNSVGARQACCIA